MSKRILAVDDSKTIQSALEITFHTIDALELSIESKGTRVRKRLQDESFDLLILDYDLPDIEVDELISQLRAVDALANLPILLLAGKSYSSSAAPKSHVDGVLRKPFQTNDLLERTSELLAFSFEKPHSEPTYFDTAHDSMEFDVEFENLEISVEEDDAEDTQAALPSQETGSSPVFDESDPIFMAPVEELSSYEGGEPVAFAETGQMPPFRDTQSSGRLTPPPLPASPGGTLTPPPLPAASDAPSAGELTPPPLPSVSHAPPQPPPAQQRPPQPPPLSSPFELKKGSDSGSSAPVSLNAKTGPKHANDYFQSSDNLVPPPLPALKKKEPKTLPKLPSANPKDLPFAPPKLGAFVQTYQQGKGHKEAYFIHPSQVFFFTHSFESVPKAEKVNSPQPYPTPSAQEQSGPFLDPPRLALPFLDPDTKSTKELKRALRAPSTIAKNTSTDKRPKAATPLKTPPRKSPSAFAPTGEMMPFTPNQKNNAFTPTAEMSPFVPKAPPSEVDAIVLTEQVLDDDIGFDIDIDEEFSNQDKTIEMKSISAHTETLADTNVPVMGTEIIEDDFDDDFGIEEEIITEPTTTEKNDKNEPLQVLVGTIIEEDSEAKPNKDELEFLLPTNEEEEKTIQGTAAPFEEIIRVDLTADIEEIEESSPTNNTAAFQETYGEMHAPPTRRDTPNQGFGAPSPFDPPPTGPSPTFPPQGSELIDDEVVPPSTGASWREDNPNITAASLHTTGSSSVYSPTQPPSFGNEPSIPPPPIPGAQGNTESSSFATISQGTPYQSAPPFPPPVNGRSSTPPPSGAYHTPPRPQTASYHRHNEPITPAPQGMGSSTELPQHNTLPPEHVQIVFGAQLDMRGLFMFLQYVDHTRELFKQRMNQTTPPPIFANNSYLAGQTIFLFGGDAFAIRSILPAILECFGSIEEQERIRIGKMLLDSAQNSQKKQITQHHMHLGMAMRPYAKALRETLSALQRSPIRKVTSTLQTQPITLFADHRDTGSIQAPLNPNAFRHHALCQSLQKAISIGSLTRLLDDFFALHLSDIIPRNFPDELIYQAVIDHFEQRYQLNSLANAIHTKNPRFDPAPFSRR
ncbi:MAG: hypothetical protein CL920_09710 [Deltaproteobacteria bacterium]|nr:hypothetical protein [Deltaproteobacteria bacterium]|tara:strand:- start:13826 stop:17077 length:3252 start_codon:yes stop_codon:yes gene_type:complete